MDAFKKIPRIKKTPWHFREEKKNRIQECFAYKNNDNEMIYRLHSEFHLGGVFFKSNTHSDKKKKQINHEGFFSLLNLNIQRRFQNKLLSLE